MPSGRGWRALHEGEEIMTRVIISEADVYPTYIATRTHGVVVLSMPAPLRRALRGSILMAVMVTRYVWWPPPAASAITAGAITFCMKMACMRLWGHLGRMNHVAQRNHLHVCPQ